MLNIAVIGDAIDSKYILRVLSDNSGLVFEVLFDAPDDRIAMNIVPRVLEKVKNQNGFSVKPIRLEKKNTEILKKF